MERKNLITKNKIDHIVKNLVKENTENQNEGLSDDSIKMLENMVESLYDMVHDLDTLYRSAESNVEINIDHGTVQVHEILERVMDLLEDATDGLNSAIDSTEFDDTI